MKLCTSQSITTLPTNITSNPNLFRPKSSLILNHAQIPRCRRAATLRSRFIYYTNSMPRATMSEETSNGASRCATEERDVAVVVEVEADSPIEKKVYNESPATEAANEESPVNELANEFLDNLNIKFDSEDTYSILLYGGGALVAVWLASAVVGAIDSIPLFPKLMEVVGLGYTLWFTTRYLLFKKNRDELAAKVEEIKQQVLGSSSD